MRTRIRHPVPALGVLPGDLLVLEAPAAYLERRLELGAELDRPELVPTAGPFERPVYVATEAVEAHGIQPGDAIRLTRAGTTMLRRAASVAHALTMSPEVR